MPRFVVLTHNYPVWHWDFMLEERAALRTWRLAESPDLPGPVAAERLADHRLAYLDYEGAVSGNRGEVHRWDRGEYTLLDESDGRLEVRLEGKALQGRALFERQPGSSAADSSGWTYCFTVACADLTP